MSTPERQQDPGEHGYGGAGERAGATHEREHPLDDPASDPRQDENEQEDEDEGR